MTTVVITVEWGWAPLGWVGSWVHKFIWQWLGWVWVDEMDPWTTLTYRNAVRGGRSTAMATGSKHKKMKFGRVIAEIRERTDKHTNRQTHHNASHPSRGRSNIR